MFKIPQNIKKIISVLESNGFEAYIVGGAVRDLLSHKTPDDYDIATSCTAEKICDLFEHTIPTGLKHGTVTVVMDSIPTEVTTYRIDGSYSDNRSPDSVTYTSDIKSDLSRRDFTINAMAYNKKTGIIDLFGGKADLEKGIIRTVGEPEKRFREDALRILRAIRFSCLHGLKIENTTYKAAINNAQLLKNISGERIFSELSKALLGSSHEVLENFINSGGLACLDIGKADNFKLIKLLPQKLSARFFAFMALTDADQKLIADRLKFSNQLKQNLNNLAILNKYLGEYDKPQLKILLNLTDYEAVFDHLVFKNVINGTDTHTAHKNLDDIFKNGEPYKIAMLDINGEDVKKMGFTGDGIGKILGRLLDKCINDPALNQKEKLIELIKNEYSN